MNYAKIDLSGMEKELRGIIHKCLNEMLEELDIKEWIESRIHRMIKEGIDTLIEKKVYAFLEEAEIEVDSNRRYGSKITINDHIIKIINEKAYHKANKILSGLKITLEEVEG